MEHNYVDKMAGAVASWASTRSDCYQGYEQFVDKIRAYDFDIALRNNKVLAGTPAAVADQLATIRDWYGDDLTISLQFNPGFTSLTEACQAMELFGTEVAPLFAPASATVS
ncbi:MAG: hypothetical protein JO285_02525 [Kutzneria sp.]|nr:hypothetical protein [Kutzneria sp.]